MLEGTTVQVEKYENGFGIQDRGGDRKYVFGSFEGMVDHLAAAFGERRVNLVRNHVLDDLEKARYERDKGVEELASIKREKDDLQARAGVLINSLEAENVAFKQKIEKMGEEIARLKAKPKGKPAPRKTAITIHRQG